MEPSRGTAGGKLTLPTEPLPAHLELESYNLLIAGGYGVGKSGLLASTGYLVIDPEGKMKAYPSLRVEVKNWNDHLQVLHLLQEVARTDPKRYLGIGLDSLNVSYDACLRHVMQTTKFGDRLLNHPSENPQLTYPRITHEFVRWLRGITLLGWHVVATCHVDMAEVRTSSGVSYNRWIPAFVGGRAGSAYAQVLSVFPLIGFMTISPKEGGATRPPAVRRKEGEAGTPTLKADAMPRQPEHPRVVYFNFSLDYLTNNKLGAFPGVVELGTDWSQDWQILKSNWKGG